MKTLLLRALLTLAVLFPVLSPAELVLFKGTRKDTYIGDGHRLAVNWRTILIIDYNTAEAVHINYATINGAKVHWASQWTNSHFVRVTGPRETYTVIARPATPCEVEGGATGEAIYAKGRDANLTINTNSSITFPKALSDHGNGLSYFDESGAPFFDDGSLQVVFDRTGTMASNKVGEGLDAALTRLIAYLESLGYSL